MQYSLTITHRQKHDSPDFPEDSAQSAVICVSKTSYQSPGLCVCGGGGGGGEWCHLQIQTGSEIFRACLQKQKQI